MHIRNFTVAATLALALALAPAAVAQGGNSSVAGNTTDTTGAAIPGAQVTLTNVNTGVTQTAITDASGNYSFPSVPLGFYNLTVSKDGFAVYKLNNFNVIVGQRATEDVKLDVASSKIEVNVNAGALADLLQPESNDLGTVIGPQTVAQIPLNGRNFLQLGLLSGATQPLAGGAGSSISQTGANSTNGNRLLSLLVAGNEPDFTMYTINGVQTIGTRAGNSSLNLSVSAVDQFEVHYGFFMPDLGPNPGIVEVATKSGTNRFHGEVYEFFRNTAMKATEWNSHGQHIPYHQHQFGVAVGGPILKDKLFGFFNYEGYRQTQSTVSNLTVPSVAMASGDFSAFALPIYNPYNVVNGQRQQFPGNKIDPSLINPAAKALLQYYATAPTASNFNYVAYPKQSLKTDQYTGRFDYTLNQKNSFFLQGTYLISPQNAPGAFSNQGSQYPLDTELGTVGWTSSWGSNKVNELRIGWTRNSVFNRGYTAPGVQQALNITGTADNNGIPGIGFTGNTSLSGFGTAAGLLGDVDNSYQANDGFNWQHGNHQIKFGFVLAYTRTVDSSANATARGSITFGGNQDFTSQIGGSSSTSGAAFADYLLGLPAHGEAKGMPPTHYRYTSAQPYIQDTWKITPKLTANLALAWYFTTPPNPSGVDKNFIHGFNFTTGLETFAALGQMNPEVYPMTYSNAAPRAGFSYQINPHTVIRGGAGIYYTSQMMLNVQYSVVSNIITVNNALTNNPNNSPTGQYILGQNLWGPTTVGQITAGQVAGITGPMQYYSEHQRSPYIYQYNMDVERTFGPYMVDVAYLGNAGHRLPVNYNPFDCSAIDFTCDNSRIPYQVNGSPKYPYMQEVDNIGWSNYNGLVAKFQRQFTNGLSILTAYTYSKALAAAQEGSNSTFDQMKSCFQCDYGKTTYNVPQALSVSVVWDLPYGHGRKFGASAPKALDLIAGGWNLDMIGQFQKGNPINITEPNSTLWGPGNTRPDWYCDGHKDQWRINSSLHANGYRWMSPAKTSPTSPGCYLVSTKSGRSGTATAPRYFGDTHFDSLDGPGINNVDLSVHKDFGIYHDWKLGLRGEFFNAFNHVSFANPDAGVASTTFGVISGTQKQARIIQVAAKLTF